MEGKAAVPLAVVSPGLKPFQDPVPPRSDVVSFEIVVIPRLKNCGSLARLTLRRRQKNKRMSGIDYYLAKTLGELALPR
jgi:hypothetical protein